jgi:hypothetical protein
MEGLTVILAPGGTTLQEHATDNCQTLERLHSAATRVIASIRPARPGPGIPDAATLLSKWSKGFSGNFSTFMKGIDHAKRLASQYP